MEGEEIFYPEKKEKVNNLLLEGPELVLSEEEKEQKREMSFCFSSDTRQYCFGYKDGKLFFVVECFNSLPDELSEKEKEKFTKEIRKQGKVEKVVYVLKYGEVPESKKEVKEFESSKSKKYRITQSRDFERGMIDSFVADDVNKKVVSEILVKYSNLNSEEIFQIVEQIFEAYRRHNREEIHILSSRFSKSVVEKIRNEIRERMLPKPQEIGIAQLVEILKDKKVLFYTGAGISIASGVPDMKQLQEMLGIEMSKKVDNLLKMAVVNPQEVINSWGNFIKAVFEKPATPAHQSLSRLAQKLKSQIFTENEC